MNTIDITKRILNCAYRVHSHLGPGLLENAYETCLFYELQKSGLYAERQKKVPLVYYDVTLDAGYRIDILVEEKVVVEIKAVEYFHDVHTAQVLTYLKLTKCRIGLMINFNVTSLTKGIKRLVW